MTHLNVGEHAARVMQREAERRGIALEADTNTDTGTTTALPGDVPAELAAWACKVAGKGWCVFAALDTGDEITTPAERDFLPLTQVLANSWEILGGTGTVRVSTSPR